MCFLPLSAFAIESSSSEKLRRSNWNWPKAALQDPSALSLFLSPHSGTTFYLSGTKMAYKREPPHMGEMEGRLHKLCQLWAKRIYALTH